MQTTYRVFPVRALAGQVAHPELENVIFTGIASEDMAPGLEVSIQSDGTIRLPRHGDTIWGVTVLRTAGPQTQPLSVQANYLAHDPVPVLRKGQIWCQTAGYVTGLTPGAAAAVEASSTIATDRGKLTTHTDSSAGTERDNAFAEVLEYDSDTGLVLVDLNLPQSGGGASPTGGT